MSRYIHPVTKAVDGFQPDVRPRALQHLAQAVDLRGDGVLLHEFATIAQVVGNLRGRE